MATLRQTVRRRLLGMELRQIRKDLGLTLEAAATLVERSPSGISKIETGKQRVLPRDLYFILDRYGVTDEQRRGELIDQARGGEHANWWKPYSGVVRDPLADYLSLETEATYIGGFYGFLVAGMLQTPAYAQAVVEASRKWEDREQIERFVALRMARKAVLTRANPLQLWVVLTEQVVRQRVGGVDVMREQLAHLVEITRDMTNVTIQLLPYDAGAHAGVDGSFRLMRFAEGSAVVCVESLTSSIYMEDEAVSRYEAAWDHIKSSALSPQETERTLQRLIREL